MRTIEFISKIANELFVRYLKEPFDIETELELESGKGINKDCIEYSSELFLLLIEKLFSKCLEEKKIILSVYLISNLKKEGVFSITGVYSDEIFRGLFLKKDNFYKIIESLELNRTKEAYRKWSLITEEEINENYYLCETEIEKFHNIDLIIEILFEEWEDMFGINNVESKKVFQLG